MTQQIPIEPEPLFPMIAHFESDRIPGPGFSSGQLMFERRTADGGREEWFKVTEPDSRGGIQKNITVIIHAPPLYYMDNEGRYPSDPLYGTKPK
jgi:hypothetical protein